MSLQEVGCGGGGAGEEAEAYSPGNWGGEGVRNLAGGRETAYLSSMRSPPPARLLQPTRF